MPLKKRLKKKSSDERIEILTEGGGETE